jgi:tetratricopeptide (TPR) repeat protein
MKEAFECQQKQQHDKSIAVLNQMIEIDPYNSDAHHYLGLSYMHQDKYKQAIAEMEYSIQLLPDQDHYYCNLGMACWKNAQREKAIDCFKKGHQLNVHNQYIHFNLAQVLWDAGKVEESLSECLRYLEKYPDDYYVFFLLIFIEHRLCKKDIVSSSVINLLEKKNLSLDKWLDSIPETNDNILFIKGVICILFEQMKQGIYLLTKSEKIAPGSGWIFTYKIIAQIRHHYPSFINSDLKTTSCSSNPSEYMGIISMNDLGIKGRLGHEIQYYLGLKQYAKKHNYCLEVSDWLGRYLFEGCDDPFISGIYETIDSKDPTFQKSINTNYAPPKKNFNLRGGCFLQPQSLEEKKYIQQLLTLRPFWRKKIDPCIAHLRKHHKTLLTIHIRRGDFIKDGRYVPSSQLYLDWLDTIWPDLDQPVLYIASDEAEKVQADFWIFNPIIAKHFGEIIFFDDFLTDFYIISQSDIVVTGGSSFSNIAALCNKKCSQFYWANPDTKRIEIDNRLVFQL